MLRFLMGAMFLLVMPTAVLSQSAADEECTAENLAQSQLIGGIDAVAATPIELRHDPSAEAELTAQLPSGTLVYITSGPDCSGGTIWWQVSFDLRSTYGTRTFGWVSEFKNADRQLKPLIPALNPTLPRSTVPIVAANLTGLFNAVEMGPLGDVQQFVWSPDSQYLAINALRAVWVYHVTAPEPNTPPFHVPRAAWSFWNEPGGISFGPDGQTIATTDVPNGDLHTWSLNGIALDTVSSQVSDYAGVAAVAPNFSRWAVSHADGSISVRDFKTGEEMLKFLGHTVVGGLAFTPDGSTLVSMGSFPYVSVNKKDNTVRIWNTVSGQLMGMIEVNMPPSEIVGGQSRIAISPDGKTAAVFAYLNKRDNNYPSAVYMIDLSSGSLRNQFTLTGKGGVGNVSFNADGSLLAVNFSSSVLFLDSENGSQLAELPFEQAVQGVEFSPDGRWLVVAHEGDNFNKSIIQFWGTLQ